MAFPPEDLCFQLPELPEVDQVCLPGGICLSYIWDGANKIPSLTDIFLDFFSQLGPAMAPLKPFFDMLDTVISLFNCVKAIPKSIMTLDPGELLNCFPALAKAVDQILKLIPQLSIPKMVKAMIHNIASLLRGIGQDLQNLERELERIAASIDRASSLGDYKMNGFLVCAQKDIEEVAMSNAQALKGIGSIVLVINLFMGLIGAQEIPCFGELVSDNIGEGLDIVVDLILGLAEILEEIASAIPDPDMILTLALGEQRC